MRPSKTSASEERLLLLKQRGVQSDVLDARLEYAEAAVLLNHHIRPLLKNVRVHPTMLPTQASGRWSTTNPPLVNFTADKKYGPRGLRDVITPDPGHVWVEWDLDQIEAKIIAAFARDEEDLQAFAEGWDIHTLTWVTMQGWERPPVLTPALFTDPLCADWRDKYDWRSKDERRRRLAKNVRYAMMYGMDEKAMDRYAVELGMAREELRGFGRQFLASKPALVACKQKWWEQCAMSGVARTPLGRKRLLLGDWKTRAKGGWNHMIQGTVADMTNWHIKTICHKFPEVTLIVNKHDGVILDWPFLPDGKTLDRVKDIVESHWLINGITIQSTAEWK